MTDPAREEIERLEWELVRQAAGELRDALDRLDPAIYIKPARDRVLVALIPEEYVAGSRLILAVGDKAPWRALVLAVGPRVEAAGLKPGVVAVVDHVTGHTLPHPGADDAGMELRLIQHADILAVFTPEE